MAECKETQLAECLIDDYALTCMDCEEAKRIRCIALARLKELTCSCMSAPIQIGGGEGAVKFPSPVEAIEALEKLIRLTYFICENSASEEGPMEETIWHDRCGHVGTGCYRRCTDRPYDRHHYTS